MERNVSQRTLCRVHFVDVYEGKNVLLMNSNYILRMYRAVQSRTSGEKQPYAYKTVAANENY